MLLGTLEKKKLHERKVIEVVRNKQGNRRLGFMKPNLRLLKSSMYNEMESSLRCHLFVL